jgi:hypothetical protein
VNYCASHHFSSHFRDEKDIAGEVLVPYYVAGRAEFVRFDLMESLNGLESTENRRSAGRHGNQYVRLRRPQVSGRDSFILVLQGGSLAVTRSWFGNARHARIRL